MLTRGLIFDIKRFTIHDGPGIRTTVFFKGCPLNCQWCHNPEAISPKIETHLVRLAGSDLSGEKCETIIGCLVSADNLMNEIKADIPFYDQSGGGATFSGGEPMAQIEFLEQLLHLCQMSNIHTAIDTCGYAPLEDFMRIYDLADLFLYDLKLIDDTTHIKYTGLSNKLILLNLRILAEKGNKINLRVPMIPGITDTKENLEAIAEFIKPLKSIRRISLLPYNRLGEDKTERFGLTRQPMSLSTQSAEIMEKWARWFVSFGYEVKIGG
jgi:pyruvate formate lyase activating enzyme